MHPIHSADVPADIDSIYFAIESQRKMVDLVEADANTRKFADTYVYTRRAELMQLLHPEEREGKEPAHSPTFKSGAAAVITMEVCNKQCVPTAITLQGVLRISSIPCLDVTGLQTFFMSIAESSLHVGPVSLRNLGMRQVLF